jgi:hypothetical protein
MGKRDQHTYQVDGDHWHKVPGRGWFIVVRAPFERHATGDVILIGTKGEKTNWDHWFVTAVEGSIGSDLTALLVKIATADEIPAPEPDPTTMTVPERLKEAERQAYAILGDLAGCVGIERNAVNQFRDKVRRLKATIVGIEFEPDCDHRWDWPDGTTRHGRPPEA